MSARGAAPPPLLGVVDLGTTRIKVGLMDADGHLVRVASRPVPHTSPDPEFYTFDPGALRAEVDALLRDDLPRPFRARVRALVFASQRATILALDDAGAPLACLGWQDARCRDLVEGPAPVLDPRRFLASTGLPLGHLFSIGKVLWLRRRHPGRFRRAARFVLLQDEILRHLAGGEPVCDPSNASATGFYDLRRGTWAPELLAAAGIDEGRLPGIRPTGSVLGPLTAEAVARTGLPAGTLVLLGGGDQQCAAHGAGVEPGGGHLCLGTAGALSLVGEATRSAPGDGFLTFAHVRPGRVTVESFMNSFGSSLDWVARLTGLDPRAVLAAPDPALLDAEACYVPFLDGAGTPEYCASAAGLLAGLRAATDGRGAIHAVAKGLVLETRRLVENTRRGRPLGRLTISGGAAGIPALAGLIARALDVPVSVSRERETTLSGAGAIGWESLDPSFAARRAAAPPGAPADDGALPPEIGRARIDAWYASYRRLAAAALGPAAGEGEAR